MAATLYAKASTGYNVEGSYPLNAYQLSKWALHICKISCPWSSSWQMAMKLKLSVIFLWKITQAGLRTWVLWFCIFSLQHTTQLLRRRNVLPIFKIFILFWYQRHETAEPVSSDLNWSKWIIFLVHNKKEKISSSCDESLSQIKTKLVLPAEHSWN